MAKEFLNEACVAVNSQDKKLGMGVERRPRAEKEVSINIMDGSKNCQRRVSDDNGLRCQDVAIKRLMREQKKKRGRAH